MTLFGTFPADGLSDHVPARAMPASGFRWFVDVAVEQGVDASRGLTYGVKESLGQPNIGQRVRVPLGKGNRATPGIVLAVHERCDLDRVKPILGFDAHGASLTAELVELARWMAVYYACPLGMVLQTMLPAAVKKGTGSSTQTLVQPAPAPEPCPKLSQLQQTVLDQAKAMTRGDHPWVELKSLADEAGAKTILPVKQLLAKGLLIQRSQTIIKARRAEHETTQNPPLAEPQTLLTLAPSQQQAIEQIRPSLQANHGGVFLLHGVTGSGKTEVYLRLIESLHGDDPGAGVIVLVPEISLTPQTVSRFQSRLNRMGIAVLHSGLTSAQRHQQWQRIRQGEAKLVIGARSAIFAPLANLRLIVVDEEHESSYKQDQLPRYHARDLAVKRAMSLKATVLLGSATPSLESYFNATVRKNYRLVELPERVTGRPLPPVEIIDMAEDRRRRYRQNSGDAQTRRAIHLISLELELALTRTLANRGQAILLLNRRGWANYIACPDPACGWVLNCDHCDATMVFHKDPNLPSGGQVRCHHCQAEKLLPKSCPICRHKTTIFGLGTQRVEEELLRKFPSIQPRMARMDRDTMASAMDYHQTLARFADGELDLLLGTQMIAKGLDFPNVQLVGVISGDTALNLPDFRAAERTFQLLAQVAGRAGRGQHPGRVLIQTFSPNDPTIQLATRHDYVTFARQELDHRRRLGFPPARRLARLVLRDMADAKAKSDIQSLLEKLTQAIKRLELPVEIQGPVACSLSRLAGYYRYELLLLAQEPGPIQKLMADLRSDGLLKSDLHTAIDVDPVLLL